MTKEETTARKLKALAVLEKVFAVRNQSSMPLEENRINVIEYAVNENVYMNEVCSQLTEEEFRRVRFTIENIRTLQEDFKNGSI